MSEVPNPHDSFFRETFGRKEIAADFLLHYLPSDLLDCLDLDTLRLSKDSFVDQELRNHYSDLLYTVGSPDDPLYVYLLFEHKSNPDPWTGLQLLRYMVRIWEQFRKQHPAARKLPLILPLVLYHGRSRWNLSVAFHNLLVDFPACYKPYIPEFRFLLHDFSYLSDVEVKGKVLGRVTLSLLKHIFDPKLEDNLPEIINLLQSVQAQETVLEILEIMLRYVVKATQRFTEEDISELLRTTSIEEDIMKTFIDKYIEQGLQQGQSQILSVQLNNRFGTLPQWALEKMENADTKTLERWSIRLLSAKSLDEVFH